MNLRDLFPRLTEDNFQITSPKSIKYNCVSRGRQGRWIAGGNLELSDGRWTSKLGQLEDIVHYTVDAISGGDYGEVVQFMRRVHTNRA